MTTINIKHFEGLFNFLKLEIFTYFFYHIVLLMQREI